MTHANANTREAARRIKKHLAVLNGGRIPRSVARWRTLTDKLGLYARPLPCSPGTYTARLVYDDRLTTDDPSSGWLIAYNPSGSARQVCRWIAHELAEYLAICEYPSIFDGMPQRVYYYNGGRDPEDARHRIALCVEKLCFRRR